jgi:hypothetical protein
MSNNNRSGMGDIKIFVTSHAVERYFERAFNKTEAESKELTSEQKYRIAKIVEKELADEHPEAFELGAGIYKSKALGISFVLEEFRVLTITENSKIGEDRRLKGGAINSGTKFGKMIKKNKREKYLTKEGTSGK